MSRQNRSRLFYVKLRSAPMINLKLPSLATLCIALLKLAMPTLHCLAAPRHTSHCQPNSALPYLAEPSHTVPAKHCRTLPAKLRIAIPCRAEPHWTLLCNSTPCKEILFESVGEGVNSLKDTRQFFVSRKFALKSA